MVNSTGFQQVRPATQILFTIYSKKVVGIRFRGYNEGLTGFCFTGIK